MHKVVVLVGVVLVFVLGLGLILQMNVSAYRSAGSQATPTLSNPYDPAYYGLPPTIAGYKVLAVETSENTVCMPPGKKLLVLQATQPFSIEEDIHNAKAVDAAVTADLEQKGLGEYAKSGWSTVGSGITLDQFLSQNQSWNEQRRKYGCVKTGPAADGIDYQEFKEASGSGCCAGYAAFEDTDAGGLYTDAYAQTVYLNSPATIANRPLAVAFENNVLTNGSVLTFFQVGMDILNGQGRIIWTDTNYQYIDQQFTGIPYLPSRNYYTSIMYDQSGYWHMCAYGTWDPADTFQCQREGYYSGTTLGGPSINTSVWFENHNTDSQWYQGFSSDFVAYGAQIDRWYGGTGHFLSWSTQDHHTEDHCAQNYDPHNALVGTLIGGYGAVYFLNYVPIVCP